MVLAKSVCSTGIYWPRVSAELDFIGQECLQNWILLIKSVCRTGCYWSRVFAGVGRIRQVEAWAGLVKSVLRRE